MKTVFALLLALACLSGCATVVKTPGQTVAVRSVPAGAEVQVSNGKSGITPFSFRASRRKECTVSIRKEGYKPISVTLESGHSTTGTIATAGNAVVGGLIGVGIDYATGSTRELRPDPVLVRLSPLNSPTPSLLLPEGSKLEDSDVSPRWRSSERTRKSSAPAPQPTRGSTDVNGTEYL